MEVKDKLIITTTNEETAKLVVDAIDKLVNHATATNAVKAEALRVLKHMLKPTHVTIEKVEIVARTSPRLGPSTHVLPKDALFTSPNTGGSN